MQNVRRHKSGSFEARIQINKVPYSAYGSTEEEAALNLEEKILRSQNLRDSYTLKQWMEERYLPSIQTTSKKHQEKAAWAIKHLEHLAHRPISQIDRAMLQAAFVRKAKTLKPETLKTLKSVWAAALNLAEADDIIPKNPMRFVKLPRSMPEPKAVLDRKTLMRLLDHSRGYAAHPIVVLGSLMGLRIGEICLLEPKHFAEPGKLIVPGTKTAASKREVPIHPKIIEELARYTFPLAYPNNPARNAVKAACFRAQIEDVTPPASQALPNQYPTGSVYQKKEAPP